MQPRRTFERIASALRYGSWHEIDDLRAATSFPEEWVRELGAELVPDTREDGSTLKTRLAIAEPSVALPHDGAGVFDLDARRDKGDRRTS